MAKAKTTTIFIDPADLKECVEFRIKQLQRAMNAEGHAQIRELRAATIKYLETAIMSIDQGELPGVARK